MNTARRTALLILIAVARTQVAQTKVKTTARISTVALLDFSQCRVLRDDFLRNLTDELLNFGWCFFTLPDADGYGLIHNTPVKSWVGLGIKNVGPFMGSEYTEQKLIAAYNGKFDNEQSDSTTETGE